MTDWLAKLREIAEMGEVTDDGYARFYPTTIKLMLDVVDASLIHKGHNGTCSYGLSDDEQLLACDCGLSPRQSAMMALRAHVEDTSGCEEPK